MRRLHNVLAASLLSLSFCFAVGCAAPASESADDSSGAMTSGGALFSPIASGLYRSVTTKDYLRVTSKVRGVASDGSSAYATQEIHWTNGHGNGDVQDGGKTVVVADVHNPDDRLAITVSGKNLKVVRVTATEPTVTLEYEPVDYSSFNGTYDGDRFGAVVTMANANSEGADVTVTAEGATSAAHFTWNDGELMLYSDADSCDGEILFAPDRLPYFLGPAQVKNPTKCAAFLSIGTGGVDLKHR